MRLLIQLADLPRSLALFKAGSRIAAKMAIMAITTSSSIRVKRVFLSEEEKRIVAAHELGHVVLHRAQLKLAPMKDEYLYNMKDNTEYQANLFAADLLLEDDEIDKMSKNEDLDYFGFCSSLYSSPELMSFKLYSLIQRGQAYHMPMELQSNFLAK